MFCALYGLRIFALAALLVTTMLPAAAVTPLVVIVLPAFNVTLPAAEFTVWPVVFSVPTAVASTLPVVAVTRPKGLPILVPAVSVTFTPVRLTPSSAPRVIAPAVAVISMFPAAVMARKSAHAPPQRSALMRLTLLAPVNFTPPLVLVVRFTAPRRMSRPDVTLIPGCVFKSPVFVAVRLPFRTMSLAAPELVSVSSPLPPVPADMVVAPIPVAAFTVTAVPALSTPALTFAPVLVMDTLPLVAVTALVLTAPGAVNVTLFEPVTARLVVSSVPPAVAATLPVAAVMLPKRLMILVPVLSVTFAPLRLTPSSTVRVIDPAVAVMSIFPVDVMLLLP